MDKIIIGKFDLKMSEDGSHLFIRLNSGEHQDECGSFPIDYKLEKVIEQFYNDNF